MANTTKKTTARSNTTSTAKPDSVKNDTVNTVSNEDMVLELKAQVESLTKQLKNATNSTASKTDVTTRKVVVVSLINNQATLSTEKHGGGVKYNFPQFGSSRRIKYDDLEKIVNTCKEVATDTHTKDSFFERGEFWIADSDVVEELGLSDYYNTILDKKKIDEIVELKNTTAVSLFEGANPEIKETIVRLMVDKINNGKVYDLNLLHKIDVAFGKSVEELAAKTKK